MITPMHMHTNYMCLLILVFLFQSQIFFSFVVEIGSIGISSSKKGPAITIKFYTFTNNAADTFDTPKIFHSLHNSIN